MFKTQVMNTVQMQYIGLIVYWEHVHWEGYKVSDGILQGYKSVQLIIYIYTTVPKKVKSSEPDW